MVLFKIGRCVFPKVRDLLRGVSTSCVLRSEELNVHRDTIDNNAGTPFQFSQDNLYRIAAIIQNYPEGSQRSAVGSALDIAQRQNGWVSIAAMNRVAEMLSMPRMRVYEWATFYSMNKRRFRGKYHVKVCVTTPCMIRGSDMILRAVEEATCCSLGQLSPDGMFGVDEVQCAGACVNAPVVVIDDDYYEDVTGPDVYNIISSIRAGNIPRPGPQNGRYACEPLTGLTSLTRPPPEPGFGLQSCLK